MRIPYYLIKTDVALLFRYYIELFQLIQLVSLLLFFVLCAIFFGAMARATRVSL
jgi:hypothetical protein